MDCVNVFTEHELTHLYTLEMIQFTEILSQ